MASNLYQNNNQNGGDRSLLFSRYELVFFCNIIVKMCKVYVYYTTATARQAPTSREAGAYIGEYGRMGIRPLTQVRRIDVRHPILSVIDRQLDRASTLTHIHTP